MDRFIIHITDLRRGAPGLIFDIANTRVIIFRNEDGLVEIKYCQPDGTIKDHLNPKIRELKELYDPNYKIYHCDGEFYL